MWSINDDHLIETDANVLTLTLSVANDVSPRNAIDLLRLVPRQLHMMWAKLIDSRWTHRPRHCNQIRPGARSDGTI